jgi:hypothetical protein
LQAKEHESHVIAGSGSATCYVAAHCFRRAERLMILSSHMIAEIECYVRSTSIVSIRINIQPAF